MIKDFVCTCIVKPCTCRKVAPVKKIEKQRSYQKQLVQKNVRRSFSKGLKR